MLFSALRLRGLCLFARSCWFFLFLLSLLFSQSCSPRRVSSKRDDVWRLTFLGHAGQFLNVPEHLKNYPLVKMSFQIVSKGNSSCLDLFQVRFHYNGVVHVFNLNNVETMWQLGGLSGEWQNLQGSKPSSSCPLECLETGSVLFILAEEREVPYLAEYLKLQDDPIAPFLIMGKESFGLFLRTLSSSDQLRLTFIGKSACSSVSLGKKEKKIAYLASQILSHY